MGDSSDSTWTPAAVMEDAEWLEADGLGGFASGTVRGARTRRYQALLLSARKPPTERFVLVNGLEAWVDWAGEQVPISHQRYADGTEHPRGDRQLLRFGPDPWPTWHFAIGGGCAVVQELVCARANGETLLRWHLVTLGSPRKRAKPRARSGAPARLQVRLLLSGRDYHALHYENSDFDFTAHEAEGTVCWRPYVDVPGVEVHSNAAYRQDPLWFRQFSYEEELQRGFSPTEDLASPGVFEWNLSEGPAVMTLRPNFEQTAPARIAVVDYVSEMFYEERLRREGSEGLIQKADAYLVRRATGHSVIAGYPWFSDWGRDTFIALRGLCLGDKQATARSILSSWATSLSEGMLPNRFPDDGDEPEYNSVDAALWFAVACHDFWPGSRRHRSYPAAVASALNAILEAYAAGTRFGIAMDDDGLLRAGVDGLQLTWMDAKADGRVITPRIGKPVEIQALWINALLIGGEHDRRWSKLAQRARRSFEERFWNAQADCLHEVVDVDHVAGKTDSSLRPNQLLAVGGLPHPVLRGERALRVVERVEAALWTPMGLRSLAPDDPRYCGRYEGGPSERDAAYHQGTVWPWLIGAFVDAWLNVHGRTPALGAQAHDRFLRPLLEHLGQAGLGHVSEIADGDPPHAPRGCPFQAWSVGELIRAVRLVEQTGAAVAEDQGAALGDT